VDTRHWNLFPDIGPFFSVTNYFRRIRNIRCVAASTVDGGIANGNRRINKGDRMYRLLSPLWRRTAILPAAALGGGAARQAAPPDEAPSLAENDVLRDEGEAYARKLTAAGVTVTSTRYNGTIHDFVMLNVLADTPAARAAIAQARAVLRNAFVQR
jgi:acetyl esterase/lipase